MSSVRSHRVRSHKSYSRNGYCSFFRYFSKRSMRMRHKKDYERITPELIVKSWDKALNNSSYGIFSWIKKFLSRFTGWLVKKLQKTTVSHSTI